MAMTIYSRPNRRHGPLAERRLERLMQDPEHAALLMDNGAGGRIKRQLVDLSDTVAAVVAKGSELTLVAAYNWGRPRMRQPPTYA